MQVDRFQAWPAINEAWQRTRGARLTYLYMTAAVFVLMFVLSSLLSILQLVPAAELSAGQSEAVINRGTIMTPRYPWMAGSFTVNGSLIGTLVSTLIAAMFTGSFTAFGLRRAQGLSVDFAMLTKYVRYALPFFMLALASYLGAMLLGVVGPVPATILFVAGSIAFSFSHVFIVDRDYGALQALEASLRVVSRNVWQTLLLLLTGGLLGLAVTLPLILIGVLLPVIGAIVLGLAVALANALVQAIMSVAIACAYRDAVGMEKSEDDLPIGGRTAPATLSSRA